MLLDQFFQLFVLTEETIVRNFIRFGILLILAKVIIQVAGAHALKKKISFRTKSALDRLKIAT